MDSYTRCILISICISLLASIINIANAKRIARNAVREIYKSIMNGRHFSVFH